MARPAKIIIHPQHFIHNIQIAKRCAPHSKILAMVKANAYGHGLFELVNAAKNYVDGFGVCDIDEAIEIRSAGFNGEVVLLEGFFNQDELPEIASKQFTAALHNQQQLQHLYDYAGSERIKTWLKINTGMNRLGFEPKAFQSMMESTHHSDKYNITALMTHFAVADELDNAFTQQQIQLFNETIKTFDYPQSLANSAAVLKHPKSHADWVRPGIMLYGASPFKNTIGADFNLKPVMEFNSKVIATHHCQQGDAIGYGQTYTCPHDMDIAVIACGYGDGYPRHARHGTPVYINGEIAVLVGRVSMDMLTIDISQLKSKVCIDDKVQLWGEHCPIERVAQAAETIGYELLCHVTQRVRH